MKAIRHHIEAIKISIQLLSKGEFLLYFIPGLTLAAIYYFFLYRTQSLASAIDLETGIGFVDKIGGYLESGISGIFSLFGFLLEQIYIFAVLTLLAPFNTLFAEKLDERLSGRSYPFSIAAFINDIFRMILVVIIALFLEFAFILIYWILSWLFGLDFIDDLAYHVIAAFFFGFSFYDYALERDRKTVGSSLFYAFEYPLSMILTGSIFLLIFNIPYIGIPVSVLLAIMLSTIVYLYNEKVLPSKTPEKHD